MKNYYQQKKGGWKLDPVIYSSTVAQIRCYRIYRRLVETGVPVDTTDTPRIYAGEYVRIIDQALTDYVPEAYRAAVFAHVVDKRTYNDLEEQYYISASTMKRYTQVFIWGVAQGLSQSFDGTMW